MEEAAGFSAHRYAHSLTPVPCTPCAAAHFWRKKLGWRWTLELGRESGKGSCVPFADRRDSGVRWR